MVQRDDISIDDGDIQTLERILGSETSVFSGDKESSGLILMATVKVDHKDLRKDEGLDT